MSMSTLLRDLKNKAGHPIMMAGGTYTKTVEEATVRILYTNWKNETSWRNIIPLYIEFRSTEWHPEEQWLLKSWDLDKKDYRSFALADIQKWIKQPGDTPIPPLPPKVVCLCGSSKFKEAFIQANKDETLRGNIVLSIGMFGHHEGLDMDGPVKAMLDELHKRKIDEADEVLILNCHEVTCRKCGNRCETDKFSSVGENEMSKCCNSPTQMKPYIGKSTRGEIEYAAKLGKPIRYLVAPE